MKILEGLLVASYNVLLMKLATDAPNWAYLAVGLIIYHTHVTVDNKRKIIG